jgi:hypothetical protein
MEKLTRVEDTFEGTVVRTGNITTTAVVEYLWSPRVTIVRKESLLSRSQRASVFGDPRVISTFAAVVEISDLAPARGTKAEERDAGILSLHPPTVMVGANVYTTDARKVPILLHQAHRRLIAATLQAVTTAIYETDEAISRDGFEGGTARQRGMAGQVWQVLRVSMALRRALRLMGEDI